MWPIILKWLINYKVFVLSKFKLNIIFLDDEIFTQKIAISPNG